MRTLSFLSFRTLEVAWAACGSLAANLAWAGEIKSFPDFETHTYAHIARVQAIGRELYTEGRATRYRSLDPEVVDSLLAQHDLAKTNSTERLKLLHRWFGEPLKFPADPEQDDLRSLISAINADDARYRDELFRSRKVESPELRELYSEIERAADQIDRGLAPESTQEFGRKMSPASAFGKWADEVLPMIRNREAQYQVEIKGLRFEDVAAKKRAIECTRAAIAGY